MDKYKAIGLINFIFGIIEGFIPLMVVFVVIVSLTVAFIDSPRTILAALDLRYVVIIIIFVAIGILDLKSAFFLLGNNQNQVTLEEGYGFGITLIFVSLIALFGGGFFFLLLAAASIH